MAFLLVEPSNPDARGAVAEAHECQRLSVGRERHVALGARDQHFIAVVNGETHNWCRRSLAGVSGDRPHCTADDQASDDEGGDGQYE